MSDNALYNSIVLNCGRQLALLTAVRRRCSATADRSISNRRGKALYGKTMVLAVLIAIVGLFHSTEVTYAQALLDGDVSGCGDEQYVDWLKTGKANAMILNCSFSTDNDRIIILLADDSPQVDLVWQENLSFKNAIWLFDAASDSSVNLIIEFSTSANALQARIFDDVNNDGEVSYSIEGGKLRILESGHPTVQVTTPDGLWHTEHGLTPNLDITVDGPINALAGYNRFTDRLATDGIAEFLIKVRDTDDDGYPNYDFRRDVSALPKNWGLYRVNLAVNEGGALPTPQGFVLWPLLGTSFGPPRTTPSGELVLMPYEDSMGRRFGLVQGYGSLAPAIQVDWPRSQVAFVAEIVPSRATDQGWFSYSIADFEPGSVYAGNFEYPFAFYDLAENLDGVPELLVRAESSPPHDPYYANGAFGLPLSMIRYSWKQEDLSDWDYSVNLLGTHSTHVSDIRVDRDIVFRSIPYKSFPSWVMEHRWEVATFVEAMDGFPGQEGIYAGSNLNNVRDYFVVGGSGQPPLEGLLSFEPLFRVEYDTRGDITPLLYMSPVDRQLHLFGAQGGLWRINGNDTIEYINLDSGFLDSWRHALNGQLVEELTFLKDHVIYAQPGRVEIHSAEVEPALFIVSPPTTHSEWAELGELLEVNNASDTVPDFGGFARRLNAPHSSIEGAKVSDIRITELGFRFVLSLMDGFQVTDPDLLGVAQLEGGVYLVEHDGAAFTLSPLIPPQLSLQLDEIVEAEAMAPLRVAVANEGTADALNLTMVAESVSAEGFPIEIAREQLDALAGEVARVLVDAPILTAGSTVRVRLVDESGQVVAAANPMALAAPPVVAGAVYGIGQAPAVVPVLAGFAGLVAVAGVFASLRRKEQPSP